MQKKIHCVGPYLEAHRGVGTHTHQHATWTSLHGFTLIELMIVVAVIAVLALVAVPSYLDYLRQARIVDAQAHLLDLQRAIEKYRVNNPSYANCVSSGACSLVTSDYYVFSVASADETSYILNATAQGSQAVDAGCTPLTLNENGRKGPDGCWKQ